MNDLSVMYGYMEQQLAGQRLPRNEGSYLNARAYRDAKMSHGRRITRANVHQLEKNALFACGLDPTGDKPSKLHQSGDETRLAAAAAVLATSIITAASVPKLIKLYMRLSRAGRHEALRQVRTVLAHGDQIQPQGRPNLTLKNFASAGSGQQEYIHKVLTAYDRAGALLARAHTQFLYRREHFLLPRVRHYHLRYFGKRSAETKFRSIEIALHMTADRFDQTVRRSMAVRWFLDAIHQRYLSSDTRIRFYLGGKGVVQDTSAYSRPTPARADTHIHLGWPFFDAPLNLRACLLIREMGHSWVFLKNYAHGDASCANLANLPTLALANADSYAWFVYKAFT